MFSYRLLILEWKCNHYPNRKTNPSLLQFLSFPYFNMQIDVCKSGLSPYDPWDVAFPRKTRALFNSQPRLSDSMETVWLLLAHNKMIIFYFLSSTFFCSAFDVYQISPHLRADKTVLALPRTHFKEGDESDLFPCDNEINKYLRSDRRSGVYLDGKKNK